MSNWYIEYHAPTITAALGEGRTIGYPAFSIMPSYGSLPDVRAVPATTLMPHVLGSAPGWLPLYFNPRREAFIIHPLEGDKESRKCEGTLEECLVLLRGKKISEFRYRLVSDAGVILMYALF